ncbi:hypothetical protein J6590_013672 [Homalodisca vitripennis]|nr:hypothetical protein J6590_013672 [Homalodisca vitripennis]
MVSGSCFGWVTPILATLLGPDSEIPMTSSQSSWMVSIIEIGNLITPIPASFLADRWGRRPLILITCPIYFLSWIIILIWPTIETLLFTRIVQGLAMGVVFTVVPLYLSEISSPEIRGSICSLFHNTWYLGHVIEYCLGACLSYRTYTYVTAALPVISFLVFYGQPESPYFLVMKKRNAEAAKCLTRLRGCSPVNSVSEELQAMVLSYNNEVSNKASWKDIFRTSADIRALYIVLGLGTLRVLNGLIAIMTYSTQTFSHLHSVNASLHSVNASDNSVLSRIVTPNNTTIVFGVIIFISSFFVAIIADLSGRRQLLMFSAFGSCVNLLLAGGYFYMDTMTNIDVSRYNWFPVLTIIVFSLFVTLGIGPVSVMYQSEMFLSNTRGFASSISAINLTLNAFFLLKFYQVLADNVGEYFIFWLFSTFCLIGLIWIYITVPETRGKTFSQIRQELTNSIQSKKNASKKVPTIPKIEISDAPL